MNGLKYSFLLTALLGLTLISCNDDYYYIEDMTLSMKAHYVATYDTYRYFSGEGSSDNLYVMSDNTSWQLSGMPEWVSASPDRGTSDMEVTLAASANPLGYERTAIFSLESKDPEFKFSQDITAVQSAGEPYLYFGEMNNTDLYVPPTVTGAPQTVDIPMFTNLNQIWWKKASTSALAPTAVSLDLESNKMKVEIPENSTNDVVTYPLSITPYQGTSPFTRYVTIYQDPAAFKSIDHTFFNVRGCPSTVQFTVDSDVEWNATCSDSWIKLSVYSGGIGKTTVKVDILENGSTSNRRGTITMRSAGNKLLQVIEINQNPMWFSFLDNNHSTNSFEFSEMESYRIISVDSDMDWTVTSLPAWVKVDPESGEIGKTDIKIVVEANNSVSPRSGEIVFSASSNVYKFYVRQKGLPFNLDQAYVYMSWKASSADVDLTCSGKWTAECNESWVTVAPESGSDSGKLKVTTTDNLTDKQRTATVTIVSDKQQLSLLVVQDPQMFVIESTSGNFNVSGGTVSVSYRSNISATCTLTPDPEAEAGTDWITFKHEADSDNDGRKVNTFTFTASPNESSKPRAAYADMKPTEGNDIDDKTYRLHLRQPGRSIHCNVSRISFFNNGGTSPECVVRADGEFEMAFIGDDHSWATLEILGYYGDWFKVSATPNVSDTMRTATLRISLKNLPEGEDCHLDIPILQYPEGVVIIKDGWGSEENWGIGEGEDAVTIKLTEWSEDKNWNI